MKKKFKILLPLLGLLFGLSGCALRTVDQMYYPPKRSQAYNNFQSVMDREAAGLDYCAPLSGENQQTVQMADLDGDGVPEHILFAKGTGEKPLKILVFGKEGDNFSLIGQIESPGYAFDKVEYIQLDGNPGYEMVVGRQLSNQVLRSVKVYRFTREGFEVLVSADYSRFLSCDLNGDAVGELLVLHPGQTETDNGIAELYSYGADGVERSTEAPMSAPMGQLKRLIPGKLAGQVPAVYAASSLDDQTLVTDVFAAPEGQLTNISRLNASGTQVSTVGNYFVYANDIDHDGVMELPELISMHTMSDKEKPDRLHLIRWYALTPEGEEIDKQYTYHNFNGGWYVTLDRELAYRVSVESERSGPDAEEYHFHIWDEQFHKSSRLLTVSVLTGENREEMALEDNRFVLHKTEDTLYAGRLDGVSASCGMTQEKLTDAFNLIWRDWKTGEA